MKKCPKCGKEIQGEAILCRYCHTRLDEYAKASDYLSHFLIAIERLKQQYRIDYKAECKRINEGLKEIEIYVDIQEAVKKLEEARKFQEEKEKYEEYLHEISKIDSANIDTLQLLLEYLSGLGEYENAVELCKRCSERIDKETEKLKEKQKERDYAIAKRYLEGTTSQDLKRAMEMFEELSDFKDAVDKYKESESRYNRLKKEEVWREKQDKKNKAKRLCIISAAIVCIIAIVFLSEMHNRKQTDAAYKEAVLLMNEGKYDEAYALFSKINYKDSNERAEEVLFLRQKEVLIDVNIGEVVKFGYYEQDNDLNNGKEDIEWIVLDREETKIFVISKYALDCKSYADNTYGANTWEECSLREWLNNSFYNAAFSTNHQDMISLSKVEADPYFNIDRPGNDTFDKIFLLSANELFAYNEAGFDWRCEATEHIKELYKYFINDEGECSWWLRTPGGGYDEAMLVYESGLVFNSYDFGENFIRPVMWIDLGN